MAKGGTKIDRIETQSAYEQALERLSGFFDAPPASVAGVGVPDPLFELLLLPDVPELPAVPELPVPDFEAVELALGGGGLSPAVSSAVQTVRKLSIECTIRSWSSRKMVA